MRDEKRSEIIHDALNFLDDEMIEEVEKLRGFVEKEELEHGSNEKKQEISMKNHRKKWRNWHRWGAFAASMCVLLTGGWMFLNHIGIPQNYTNEENEGIKENAEEDVGIKENAGAEEDAETKGNENRYFPTDGVGNETEKMDEIADLQSVEDYSAQGTPEVSKKGCEIPAMEVNLKGGGDLTVEADMLGFFIHEGRCYVQYDYVRSGADFVGECVGTIHGLIDEWTPADGYVEGAGTFTGKIYEVEGISPEFMLCTIWDDGVVETYINNNGITLYEGSDLVDDRLQLRNNVKAVSFQTNYEYFMTQNDPVPLEEEHLTLFHRFLDSFAENDFVYTEDKSYYPFGGNSDNSDIYHLYFTTENGLVFRFTLMGDGYVCFPWLNGVCVQIDQEIYDDVVEVLQENIG